MTLSFCRFSGHHFSCEKSNAVTGVHLSSSFDSEFNRDHHWHHRGRSNSSVSAMSGIVFQVRGRQLMKPCNFGTSFDSQKCKIQIRAANKIEKMLIDTLANPLPHPWDIW